MTAVAPIARRHREPIATLLRATPEFDRDEVSVALELVDASLSGAGDYRALVYETDGRVAGYICFGPTPMTQGTWDLYWIAVGQSHRQAGVGRELLTAMTKAIEEAAGRLIRVETSGQPAYAATRTFYERCGFAAVARIRDFYRLSDDLVIYGYYLQGASPQA